MPIMADLADLFPDTLVAKPGYFDGYGDWASSGTNLNIPCYIEGRQRTTYDKDGEETLSSYQVYLDGYYALNITDYRFSIPTRYTPDTDLVALSIEQVSDETGPVAEVIYFK